MSSTTTQERVLWYGIKVHASAGSLLHQPYYTMFSFLTPLSTTASVLALLAASASSAAVPDNGLEARQMTNAAQLARRAASTPACAQTYTAPQGGSTCDFIALNENVPT